MRAYSFSQETSPSLTSQYWVPCLTQLTSIIFNYGSTLDPPSKLLKYTNARPHAQRFVLNWSGVRPGHYWFLFFQYSSDSNVENQYSTISTGLFLSLNAFLLAMLKLTQYCQTRSKIIDDNKSASLHSLRSTSWEPLLHDIITTFGRMTYTSGRLRHLRRKNVALNQEEKDNFTSNYTRSD